MDNNTYNGFQNRQFSQPDIPDVLDLDPGQINNPYYQDQYARRAALKGLQLNNQHAQQQIDLADPERMRIEHANDLNAETGLENNQGGRVDKYKAGLEAMRKFGVTKAEGQAKNFTENEAAFMPAAKMKRQEATSHDETQHQYKMDEIRATADAKPIDSTSAKSLATLQDVKMLGDRILPMIDQLDVHAKDYTNLGLLQKLPGLGYGSYQNYLYNKGVPVDKMTEDLDQLVALLKAKGIASMSVGGRPSIQWIELLGKHLADPSQPMGTIRERVSQIISMIPQFEQNILDTRRGSFRVGAGGGGNDPAGIR